MLLNRAPTLHRLGIQAFEPVLIEGKAIQLHPLVCAAFNADFDGDQMAVHVPLSLEAQLEARVLMMSTNNILHPANGSPIIVPSQDIVLGLYYLSIDGRTSRARAWSSATSARSSTRSPPRRSRCTPRSRAASARSTRTASRSSKIVRDHARPHAARRAAAEEARRSPFDLVNQLMTKKEISNMIDAVYRHCGQKETVIFCDRIMALGFYHAFKAGISFGKDDMVIPETKERSSRRRRSSSRITSSSINDGLITQGEKYNKVVDAWAKCTDQVAEEMMERISSVQTRRRPAASSRSTRST